MVQTIYIYNQCDMVAKQPQIVETAKVIKAKAQHITLKRIYRKQLQLAQAAARVIDHHPTLSNVLLVLMGVGFLVEVFMLA